MTFSHDEDENPSIMFIEVIQGDTVIERRLNFNEFNALAIVLNIIGQYMGLHDQKVKTQRQNGQQISPELTVKLNNARVAQ